MGLEQKQSAFLVPLPKWLELPMTKTNLHGLKDVRVNEIRLSTDR